jgi:glycerol-3-phosphate acyltransferase PlsX
MQKYYNRLYTSVKKHILEEIQMKIALDAMGSDNCPEPEISAAVQAVKEFGDEIFLVGPEEILRPRLEQLGADLERIKIVPASERITMQDKGLALALKAKRKGSKTSMAVAMDSVISGEADAILTAGNTGGALATAYYRFGTILGVDRPAVTGLFPTRKGHAVVLDIGANPEVKPEHLVQFAVMGTVYAQKINHITHPRLGLLSNGEEPGKGNQLVKETYPLLEAGGFNFIGNVEAKEIFGGEVDVVVTDGFSGNILLKTSESVAKLISEILRDEIMKSMRTKIGGLLAKPAFTEIKKMLDPGEIGAAPLLGVNGLVFKGHGRSDAHAMISAIRTTRQAVEVDLLKALQNSIQDRLNNKGEPMPILPEAMQ